MSVSIMAVKNGTEFSILKQGHDLINIKYVKNLQQMELWNLDLTVGHGRYWI
jgi:hypothetical protein